jgi:hypothetical protein
MIRVDVKGKLLHAYFLQREKMMKRYAKMFRLLSATILNSMVICRANSQWKQIDCLKFKTVMVQALLLWHGSGLERNFPEKIPPTGSRTRGRRQCFGVDCEASLC